MPVDARLTTALAELYTLVQELGQGGMATVYLARDVKHDREVALKVLRPELAAILGRERFLSEIRLTARLDHPHILTLLDSGESDGFLWYTLPYIRGESLRHKLERETQLSVDEAVSITRQIAGALEHAHQHGIIHRDVKPENILLHEGEAMLADFGIALAVKEAGGKRLTETGLSLGTPGYMSPEQATAEKTLDARSDVYSLGAVLYEMLAGEPPFTGATGQAVIAKLMVEQPSSLRTVRGTIPVGLEAVVLRALAKVPADRFPSAAAFAEALAAPETQRAPRRVPRNAIATAAAGAVVLVVSGVWLAPRIWPGRSALPRGEPSLTPATFSGTASNPALSPDGKQLAYSLSTCAPGVRNIIAQGKCVISIVVEDLTLGERRTLTNTFDLVFGLTWSPDQQFLTLKGVRQELWGQYVLSLFGGRETYLGPFSNGRFLGSSDTVIAVLDTIRIDPHSPGTPYWFHLLSRDGRRLDSIPYDQPAEQVEPLPSADGRRILAYPDAYTARPIKTLYLLDREGRLEDSLPFPAGFRVSNGLSWEPSGQGILVFAMAESGPPERWSLLRFRVSPKGRIRRVPDTLASRLLLPGQVGGPVTFALSAPSRTGDHALLLRTPTSSISTLERASLAALPALRATLVPETSAELGAIISPDGTRVAVLRPVVVEGKPATQVEVWPFGGGAGAPLGPPLKGLRDLAWSRDSRVIHRLANAGRPGLLEFAGIDAATGRVLRSMIVPDSLVWAVCDSLLFYRALATSDGKAIEWRTPPGIGSAPMILRSPDTTAQREWGELFAAPDGRCSLARLTSRALGDTIHTLSITRPGEPPVRMMDFTLTEANLFRYFSPPPRLAIQLSGLIGGEWRWYHIEPDRPVRDLGPQPAYLFGTGTSLSADGRRGVAVRHEERTDIWLLRWPGDTAN